MKQQGGELHARLPTARERTDRLVEHHVGRLELPSDLAAAPVGLLAVAHQEVEHRLAIEKRIVLPQIAEAQLLAPHHFAGVATVCVKLFSQVTPDIAIFGEKDFQQLAVLRQTVRDLDLPLVILGAPTSRDPDGLARSSRNAYLSVAERDIAPALYRALEGVAAVVAAGGPVNTAIDVASRDLLGAGFREIDYIDVRDADTLELYDDTRHSKARVLAAAWLGSTRLIDNVAVPSRTSAKRTGSRTMPHGA